MSSRPTRAIKDGCLRKKMTIFHLIISSISESRIHIMHTLKYKNSVEFFMEGNIKSHWIPQF